MAGPNHLIEPLVLGDPAGARHDEASLCHLVLTDGRRFPCRLLRPLSITLRGAGFEASYLASYEDAVALRDRLSAAVAAIQALEEA